MNMKKIVLLFAIMSVVTLNVKADVKIDETTFPDEYFRNWVLSQEYGADGVLTNEELKNVTSLNISRLEIHNLKGIEYFTALKDLNCMTNKLTMLDLSKNTALENLECRGNRLTTINLLENRKLKSLKCGGISYGNQLTSLDVSNCTELDTLACSGNPLKTLDVSKNTKLKCLECYSNQLTSLDLSKNTKLIRLHCNDNQLATLDVSKNTALELLQCSNNLLTTLDVTKTSALTSLSCTNNQLTTLYVPGNKTLESIICSDNQLSSLDVSGCSALNSLSCGNNQLTTLYLSGCSALKSLNCNNNQFTTLDLSENTALTTLYCMQNQIKGIGMDALVESLPTVSEGSMIVMYFENEQNVMTTKQVAAAKAKGWTPYIFTYDRPREEYDGSETTQDDYRPFVEDDKVWKVGDVYSNPVQVVDYYYFDGDTIINGKTCKQMMRQRYVSPEHPNYDYLSQEPSLIYVGAWYEEDKKVYEYDTTLNQFTLMYDFSLDEGGIFQKDGLTYVIGPKQTGDLKGFKGVYRNVMQIWDGKQTFYNTTWLEGVGSLDSPITNVYPVYVDHDWFLMENGVGSLDSPTTNADPNNVGSAWFLMACGVGDEVIYLNDECEDGATPELSGARKHRFDFTHTTKIQPKTRMRSEAEPSLYGEYNEQQLSIHLDPINDAYQVSITDASGKVAYEKTINAGNIVGLNIDISSYPKGYYNVTVENDNESFTGTFEAQTTGIMDVRKKAEEAGDRIYNLQGQRLNSLQKGLNIVNGQKVYVK